MARTSKENFEFFKEEVSYWAGFLGIFQWDFRVFHMRDDDALARVDMDGDGRVVCVTLAKTWERDKISNYSLSKTAFHEVCEVLLFDLNQLASPFVKKSRVEEAIHKIIRRMENTIFEYEYKRRFPERLSKEHGVEGKDSSEMRQGCTVPREGKGVILS